MRALTCGDIGKDWGPAVRFVEGFAAQQEHFDACVPSGIAVVVQWTTSETGGLSLEIDGVADTSTAQCVSDVFAQRVKVPQAQSSTCWSVLLVGELADAQAALASLLEAERPISASLDDGGANASEGPLQLP